MLSDSCRIAESAWLPIRRSVWTLLLTCCATPQFASAQQPPAPAPPFAIPETTEPVAIPIDDGVKMLDPSKMIETWVQYCDNDNECTGSWTAVKRAGEDTSMLVCRGRPFGYLRSRESYENFELGLEWRYPTDAAGNSGILVFVDGTDKIWPKAIQVQFHNPAAGSIFPIKPAICANNRTAMDLARPVNEWNTCHVVCRDGRVSAEVNGIQVGEVAGCLPKAGSIALQSEGAEVHFRNIWVRPLQTATPLLGTRE